MMYLIIAAAIVGLYLLFKPGHTEEEYHERQAKRYRKEQGLD